MSATLELSGGTSASEAGMVVMRRLDALAQHSSEPDALTRLYLTPQHKSAALQVMAWMR